MTPEARAEALSLAESLAETYGKAWEKHHDRAAELERMAREKRALAALLRFPEGQAFEPGTVIERTPPRWQGGEIAWRITGYDSGCYTCMPAHADPKRGGWTSQVPCQLAHSDRYVVVP